MLVLVCTPDCCRLVGLHMIARRIFIVVGMIVAVAVMVLPAIQVCRDWAFIDRNTGSRKGYRDWPFGWRTGSWYRESALETFMRSIHPSDFQQDWVSYAGTGKNVFGRATLTGHGRPGRIILLAPEVIDDYCRVISEVEKRRLYDVFSSGDERKIRELVDHIIESGMTSEKSASDNAANRNRTIRGETK